MATANLQSSQHRQTERKLRKQKLKECRWRIMGRDVKADDRPYIVCLGSSERDLMRRLRKLFDEKSLEELNAIDSIWIEHFHKATPFRPAEWFPIEEILLQTFRLRASAYRLVEKQRLAGIVPKRPRRQQRCR